MKHLFLSFLTASTLLVSCSTVSTDPAPTRATRTATTVTVTYARTASTIASDTTLVGPQLDVYLLPATTNADGTLSYPTTSGLKPFATITDFANPHPLSLTSVPITVQDGVPSLGVRLMLSTVNRPGRRTNAQRLTASLLINGTSRATLTESGTSFSRTAMATNGRFSTVLDTNVAGYVY